MTSVIPPNDERPELTRILNKLRPFQREAYDFATKGVIHRRQFSHANRADSNSSVSKIGPLDHDPKLIGHGRLLLADEMGLGKSVTSLAIMTHYIDEWPLLILCPASLRFTWPGEIEKFLPHLPPSAVYVVQGFDDADFYDNETKRKRIKVVVATYSLLQNRSAAARVLQDFEFKCVIADESHNLKQKNSQRAQLAFPLLQNSKRLLLLSGTPALARPVELWTQVYVLAPKLFGNYTTYTKQYCNARRGRFGWDVSGLSNADDLHCKLRQIMVRRLKSDVLDELPPKQRSIIPVAVSKSKRKECESLMKDLRETRQSVADLVGDDAYGANFEARKLLMQAYQASGIAKAEGVCEYLLEWIRGSGTQKVLVFAHHKGVMDAIETAVAKEFKGGGYIRIDGTVGAQERALRVKKFQSCGTIKVGILSMTAAGVGLTLTAASTVMFAELHWTPGVLAQAEDRCHRISQRNAVHVMYLVCDDSDVSVDMQLWRMLGRKINSLGRVVDGQTNACLDAEKSNTPIAGGNKGMVSEQDELLSFFADSSISKGREKSQTPVKGTIMSFFEKQKAAEETKSKASKKSDTVPSNVVEWDCEACTFHNSQHVSYSRPLRCELCQLLYIRGDLIDLTSGEEAHSKRHVTPRSSEKSSGSRKEVYAKRNAKKVGKISTLTECETIVIDDDDDTEWGKASLSSNSSDRESKRLKASHSLSDQPKSSSDCHQLTFSVSRNSGRILIHYANTGDSSLASFEVEHIVTEETADKLMEAKLSRKQDDKGFFRLNYNNEKICQVIRSIDTTKLDGMNDHGILMNEIKQFVDQYMTLREVEKKILQESGRSYSSFNLKQAVLREISPSESKHCTQRYKGGAKERAKERMENGVADATDMAVLQGHRCAYCGGTFSRGAKARGVESTYCSRDCANSGRLKRGGMWASSQIRAQVFALEGGVCQICGVNAHALFNRIVALQPAERLNALCNVNWKLPKTARSLERLLQDPKEGDFWNADHIKPVAEGGGNCDLDNLRTLCTPCHAGETEKLQKRLKLAPGSSQSRMNESSGSHKQTDIRAMFRKAAPNEFEK